MVKSLHVKLQFKLKRINIIIKLTNYLLFDRKILLKYLKLMKIIFLQMVYHDVATKELLLLLAWAARTQAHLSQIMM